MAREIIGLPSMSNVVAGSTATLSCPVKKTYEQITFVYSGVTRAQMQNIEVRINGKTVQEFADGDELDAINDYYGRSDVAGYLTLYFNRPEMATLPQQRVTGLGTADVDTLTIHMDIDAAAASPVIEATAIRSDAQPLGAFVKIRAFPKSSATSGAIEIDSLPKGPRYMAMHMFKSDISNIEVELDRYKIVEMSKGMAEVLQKEAGRVPQTASCTHIDFCMEGDLTKALVTAKAQDFRLRATLDTSGAIRTVVEMLDGFQGV